jgi:hypothetical protein
VLCAGVAADLLLNRYEKGNGITAHADNAANDGTSDHPVVSVSLGASLLDRFPIISGPILLINRLDSSSFELIYAISRRKHCDL